MAGLDAFPQLSEVPASIAPTVALNQAKKDDRARRT
jgi:hypothetical protein